MTNTNKLKIMAAMSGGVDSSVAAYLLKKQGYDVAGVTFIMTDMENSGENNVSMAAAVCANIGIPHHVCARESDFERHVIEPFVCAYENGLTPNPCVECNKFVKIPSALDFANLSGFGGAATGHYVRTERDSSTGRVLLKKAIDQTKDQSYVLWTLTQDMLQKLHFPLGGMTKDEIREIAHEQKLASANQKDSQDICFIPGGDYAAFIARYRRNAPEKGSYISSNGEVIGVHSGQSNYTIGQRKGLGMSFGKHMYVIAKDAQANTVTLDSENPDGSEPRSLYTTVVKAKKINLIACDNVSSPIKIHAKVRYRQVESPATAEQTGADELTVTFDASQRAISRGQSLVMYDGDTIIGGGEIL